MIHEVEIERFQALRSVQASLEPFTVIVGANATGKSSFLDALAMLAHAREGDDEARIFHRTGDARRQWQAGARTIGSSDAIHIGAGTARHKVVLNWAKPPNGGWSVDEVHDGVATEIAVDARSSVYETVGFGRAVRLRLDASVLSRPAILKRDYKEIATDGEGFAAVLQDVQLAGDGGLERIASALSGVVPSTSGVRTKRVNLPEPMAQVEVRIGGPDGGWCPAEHLSEGTLLTLAILTTLHAPMRPQLLLLDDVDRGLHPRAQRELITCLRGLQASNDSLQLVCTTHSPYLLDEFTPEEIRVFNLDAAGHTVVRRLADHPDAEKWQGQLSTGEFWSSVGEDWVLGQ